MRPPPPRPWGGWARWAVLLAVVAGWYATLAPSVVGGPVTPVLTRGVSMQPTMSGGDLAIGYRDRRPEVGDIVIARHPSGPLVVHRMIGRDAEGIVTQGDNLGRPDPWRTAPEDVLGTVRFTVGGAWRVLAVLQDPRTMGLLAALLVVAVGGLRSSGDPPTSPWRPSAPAVLSVVVVGAAIAVAGTAGGTTASFALTSDQLVGFIDPAPLEPTYVVNPGGGGKGGGGGGGGACPPAKPNC